MPSHQPTPTPTPTTHSEWLTLFSRISSLLASNGNQPPPPQPTAPPLTPATIAQLIDHTLLTPDATPDQISTLCSEAAQHGFRTVCVRPAHVAQARSELEVLCGDKKDIVGISCVIGFPVDKDDRAPGYSTRQKVEEAVAAVAQGATELDVVMEYEGLKRAAAAAAGFDDGDDRGAGSNRAGATATATQPESSIKDASSSDHSYSAVHQDILAIRSAIPDSIQLKVILEISQLASDQDVVRACIICCLAGADLVKTSTGFRGAGATLDRVRLMGDVCRWCRLEGLLSTRATGRSVDGTRIVRVKASGGIRTLDHVLAMVDAGAERIGASAGVAIMREVQAGRSSRIGLGSDDKNASESY